MMKKTPICSVILMMTLPILGGCHQLQLARSPMPISLHGKNQTLIISGSNAFVIDTEKTTGKNKPSKHQKIPKPVHLLENWF